MKHSKDLIDQAVRDTETSEKSSRTGAGRTDNAELVDAINQLFALFRINYHNQFYSAFVSTELLNQAKKLWLEALWPYSPATLLLAARQIIEESEYLPTLNRMIVACDAQDQHAGLPSAEDAYLQACLAPHPKAAQDWEHPIVYFAGSETGWFDLENKSERETWPVFKRHYLNLRRRFHSGEHFEVPVPPALPSLNSKPLSREEGLEKIRELRVDLDK